MASEKKMRENARELLDENHVTELAPFSFPSNGFTATKLHNVPISYVPHLWNKIEVMLNQCDDDQRG